MYVKQGGVTREVPPAPPPPPPPPPTSPPAPPPTSHYLYGPGPRMPSTVSSFFDFAGDRKDLRAYFGAQPDQIAYRAGWGDKTIDNEAFNDPLYAGYDPAKTINRARVVTDPVAPSGKSVRTVFPNGKGAGFTAAIFWDDWTSFTPDPLIYPGWSGPLGSLDEMYIRTSMLFEDPWQHHTSKTTKLFYFGWSATGIYLQYRPGGELRLADQSPARTGLWESATGGWIRDGVMHEIEIYMVADSGAGDGRILVWIDNNLVAWKSSNLRSGEPNGRPEDPMWGLLSSDGIQMGVHWGGGFDRKTQDDFVRVGGFHLAGA